MSKFVGTGVAMVTPFKTNGEVDYPALEKLTNHLVHNGIDYLVVHGTTAESVTLTKDEKQKTLECIQEVNNKRLPIMLGVGSNNTKEVLASAKQAESLEIDGILSVSPFYNKPTQKGIFEHYKALSENTSLDITLYNVPGRTASNMVADTTIALSELKNIVAIKEASGDLEQCMHIIENTNDDFLVISGDDTLTLPLLACGGNGVISVVANAFPRIFSDMVRAGNNLDFKTARNEHYKLNKLIPLLFKEGNPAGIKAVLNELGIGEDTVRLPLVEASNNLRSELKAAMPKVMA